MARIASFLERTAVPPHERWLQVGLQGLLGILTLLAVVYAARSSKSAQLSARAAREASDHVYLRDLKSQYDDSGYLMRFWRLFGDLEPYRKEHGFWSRDINELRQETGHKALWDDALGGNQMNLRYDLLTFYDFVLRMNAWLTRSSRQPEDEDVQLINEYFGPWLVGTMLRHRLIACTLSKAGTSRNYYRRYYGLNDEQYTQVVDLLLNDLLGRKRLSNVLESSFVRWNGEVAGYLASADPA